MPVRYGGDRKSRLSEQERTSGIIERKNVRLLLAVVSVDVHVRFEFGLTFRRAAWVLKPLKSSV